MFKTKFLSLLFLVAGFVTTAQQTASLNLLPVPKILQLQNGNLTITNEFSVSVNANTTDTILLKAAYRFYNALNRRTGLYFLKEKIGFNDTGAAGTLQVNVKKSAKPVIGSDESYTLKVNVDHITVDAATTTGALHAFQTILQLCEKNGNQYSFPVVTINDEPRYAWRGLMIDVSRHFIPLDVIERNIDAMATVKMNVLHLHLTDDQGFRIESKTFPLLQQKGSRGEYYTQAEIKNLVAYAQERGIEIVPEFDLPGHSKSWFAGYPELASAPGPYEPGTPVDYSSISGKDLGSIIKLMNVTAFPTIDPTKDKTYAFLDKFIAEMAALFPSSYMHIGADENNGVAWKNNPAIVAFMKKNDIADVHALQAYFVHHVLEIIKKNNKRMIGWEELFSTKLPKDVTVQVWQNNAYLKKAMDNGNPVLLSKGFYLDLFMPAYIHYNNSDIPSGVTAGFDIKGGEAAQWTEIADKNNIETRVWPRAAAIAERLWSPATVTDVDDLYKRLSFLSRQLDEQGLQHKADYEKSIRSYTNDENYVALKTLTDVLTPIKGYKKLFARFSASSGMLYQSAPLNEASDFIFVDSEAKWKFRAAVHSYLLHKDSKSENIINDYLTLWQGNNTNLGDIFEGSFVLAKVQQHSKNLSKLAALGKMAMENIKTGSRPTEEWTNESVTLLKNAALVFGETELAIVPEIEALVKQKMELLPSVYSSF